MIQFNLLPDVKLAYIKAERTKRLVISVSVLAGAVALGIFVLLFMAVNVAQRKNISDLNKDVASNIKAISDTENVNKILTVQSQMASLSDLHAQKPAASRLFTYIGQVTPNTVTIDTVTADFVENTLVINGAAGNLDNVNTFVDTLKFTTFTSDKNKDQSKAFSEVVLTGFSRTQSQTTYAISLKFDPAIFDNSNNAKIQVPNTVTTRSVTELPAIFKQSPTETR
jgi:Tfp pilus assembly protein PilN